MEPVSDPRIYSNRYQVTHLIARGGMAMVYRAHDLLLNRAVALKILYAELSIDTNFVERFRREAQAAANLSHPNIVPVFDWGEDEVDGTYFIVMELIEGTSLAELLRDSRTLSPTKSAEVCAQVAAALSYAHRQNVVHRDVKPGNILLTTDGQVKVTDFGIAQAISTEDNLTVAGSVMGTATYFSPEQAEGAVVDGRSDVYSLGVVLYELLAGRPPFMGDTPVAVASKHVRDVVPSPRQFNPSLPADLESITLLALAKNPADRYQTADEFRADLLRFTEGQPVSASGKRAIMGEDVTTAVAAVAGGAATAVALAPERTAAVPLMPGPRTDIRRKRNWMPWVTAATIVALALLGGIVYAATSGNGVYHMPPLQGVAVGSATTTLQNKGLNITINNVGSKTVARGLVISTIPIAGTVVHSGQSVTLVVSAGAPPAVTIPNVQGFSLSNATLQLQNLGLLPKLEFTDQGTPNVVISQSPGPGPGHKGDIIILIVLNPNSPVPVPAVAGQTISAASAAIGAAGFTVSATQVNKCSNTVASGLVIGTSPNAPTAITAGSSVQLIVSSGVCNVIVPTVVNDTQAAATSALNAQGLVPNFVNGDNGSCHGLSDVVIGQDVQGGTQAAYGSTVNLTYCPPKGQ